MKNRGRTASSPASKNVELTIPLPSQPMASGVASSHQSDARGQRSPSRDGSLAELCINTIRTLSMDAVQQAEFRPPRYADGFGAGHLHAVATLPTF